MLSGAYYKRTGFLSSGCFHPISFPVRFGRTVFHLAFSLSLNHCYNGIYSSKPELLKKKRQSCLGGGWYRGEEVKEKVCA